MGQHDDPHGTAPNETHTPPDGAAKARSNGRGGGARSMAGMNVVMFITDQERAIQHFPPGWAKENLPGLDRLQRHGLTFENAFTNSCMCSPARATLMTGFFPAQHGVKYTLEEDMPGDQFAQVEMPKDLRNIAGVMSAAGYTVVYKGKWHLSKKTNPDGPWVPEDVEQYGFTRWNPPDAGANQDILQAGGGWPNHDQRFMEQVGADAPGNEGSLQYLRSKAARQQPFFMIISLVNPHDVLFYPSTTRQAGYEDPAWFQGELHLPATVDEDLSTKPSVQAQFRALFDVTGPLPDREMKREYLNFYGNLMKDSDAYLVQVLDTLDATGLMENTVVIRTSDHGEMGMAHGGLRQKNFNFYEESLRVPLVYSNRKLYPDAETAQALVSHVDFLPTLASLFHVPRESRSDWEGVDYSSVVLGEGDAHPQRYVVFTWDDWQAGQSNGKYLPPPNHIVSIREERWKLAKYYDADTDGGVAPQWEMYDLHDDPLERHNLAWPGYPRSEHQEHELRRLTEKLAEVEQSRLQPLPTTIQSPVVQTPSSTISKPTSPPTTPPATTAAAGAGADGGGEAGS